MTSYFMLPPPGLLYYGKLCPFEPGVKITFLPLLVSIYCQLDIVWSYLRRESLSWKTAPVWGPVVVYVCEKLYGLMINKMVRPSPLWVTPSLSCIRTKADERWCSLRAVAPLAEDLDYSTVGTYSGPSQWIWNPLLVSVGTMPTHVTHCYKTPIYIK